MGTWTFVIFIAVVLIQVIGAIVQQSAKKKEEERMREAARQRRQQTAGSSSGGDSGSRTAPPTRSSSPQPQRRTESSPQRAATRLDDLAARRKAQLEELRRKRLAQGGSGQPGGSSTTPRPTHGGDTYGQTQSRYSQGQPRSGQTGTPQVRVPSGSGGQGTQQPHPGFKAPSGMTSAPKPARQPQQQPEAIQRRSSRTSQSTGGRSASGRGGGIDLSGIMDRPNERREREGRIRRSKRAEGRKHTRSAVASKAIVGSTRPAKAKDRVHGIHAALHDRERLRDAIILREILDPPVSLRGQASR